MARPCNCGSGKDSWWEYDGRGIPMARVCPQCERERMGVFKPEIRDSYTQSDVDCRIEPEDS
jgi:hypothetical protein